MRLCFGKVSKLATAVTRVRLSNLSCSYNDFLGSLFNGMHFGHAAPRGGEFMNRQPTSVKFHPLAKE